MSDTSKKRSRKSKLVPRDCGDDEETKKSRMEKLTKTLLSELETEDKQLDSLPNPLQTVLPKLRTQLDKTDDHDEPDTSAREINFSVNVEVEECDSDDNSGKTKNDVFNSYIRYKYEGKEQQRKWPVLIPDQEYRSAIDKLSKITRALADKILEVHIRNYLGRYVNEEPFEKDCIKKSIQDQFVRAQNWQKKSKVREAILSYKCYVCDIGWWHLGPFEEHIREHGDEINISIQTSAYETWIVAYLDNLTGIREIPIEGRCWKCMKTWDEHANLKRHSQFYHCLSCTFRSPTCSALFEHEGVCVRYHKEQLNETMHYEMSMICTICKINCVSKDRLKAHLTLTHFARSDFLCTAVTFRTCPFCSSDYVFHVLHTCRNRAQNVVCNYCMRKFPGKTLADIHMTYTRKNVRCRVCHEYLRSECMEAEHMTKHSKNYVLLYKCTACPNITFFHNEKLMKEHKRAHPDKKNFKASFEMIVAPRRIFPSLPFNEDEMIAPVKPHILGPKLAPLPKKPSLEQSTAETKSAVEAIRYDHHDVHGHDYLLHPYDTVTEIQNITAPTDETQQQVSDDTLAAIQSISEEVIIKTETEEYEYYDQTEMDVVYEDIDIKKEEFLDTLSNAFVSAEDVTDNINDQDISNVFKMSKQIVTVIKEEKKIQELLDDNSDKMEEVADKTEEIQIKKESQSDEDDFEDDIIVLNDESETNDDLNDVALVDDNKDNNENKTTDAEHHSVDDNVDNNENKTTDDLNDVVPVDDNEDNNENKTTDDLNDDFIPVDDDDVTIIKEENETIDISDTEMQGTDDDSNKSSNQSHETSSNETNKENDEDKKLKVKKERAQNKIYKCTKCDFKAEHRAFQKHMKTHSFKPEKEFEDPWSSYPCTKCDNTYTTFKRYIQHLRMHKIPPKTCPECMEIFTQQSQLLNHVKGHIRRMFTKIHIILEKDTFITSKSDKVYQCKKCVQVIKYRKFFKHWESHLKLERKRQIKVECKIERNEEVEEGELAEMELSADMLKQVLELLRAPSTQKGREGKPDAHFCFLCARPFSRGPYLKRHYVEHLLRDALCKRVRLSTETIACQLCGEEYGNNLQYKQHMRNHACLPVYRCELCARSFSDSSNFAKHKKVHNMAAAACELCGAKFFKRDAYAKHMRNHQQTEPIKCEHCPKVFYATNHYRKHQRSAHSSRSVAFTCGVCLTKFPSTKERLDHMWTVHRIRKKKVDCPVCNRSFRKFLDMKYHLKIKHNAGLKLSSKHFFSASEADRTFSWVHLDRQGRLTVEKSEPEPKPKEEEELKD